MLSGILSVRSDCARYQPTLAVYGHSENTSLMNWNREKNVHARTFGSAVWMAASRYLVAISLCSVGRDVTGGDDVIMWYIEHLLLVPWTSI